MQQQKIICLLVILGICAITDLKEKKIKNNWIIIGIIGAFIFLVQGKNVQVIKDTLLLSLVFFGVLFPLFFIRALGAGDVKLLCMTVLYIGRQGLEIFLIGMVLTSGMLAVGKMLYFGTFKKRMEYFVTYLQRFLMTRTAEEYGIPSETTEVIGMAVPVFVGGVSWCLWNYIGSL